VMKQERVALYLDRPLQQTMLDCKLMNVGDLQILSRRLYHN
jgi:hypothetical protein